MTPSPPKPITTMNELATRYPVLGALIAVSLVNWLVYSGVIAHMGGDALGTLPSRSGFVVGSKEAFRPVSESAWVFSLIYSAATLLLTPPIWIAAGLLAFRGHLSGARLWARRVAGGLLLVCCVGWYWNVGSAALRSVQDWQKLNHSTRSVRS